jgi:hypothetical protein
MPRRADHVHALRLHEVRVQVGEHEELATARAHFLHVRLHLLQQRIVGRDHHHRHVLVHQRQRAVLELAGGIGLGVDIGDFLQFQGAFQRHRIMHAAAQEERVVLFRKAVRPGLDLRLQVQRMLHRAGQVAQRIQVAGFLLVR